MANGRCRLHGGATPSGPRSKLQTWQIRRCLSGRLAVRFEQMKQDGNPLDMVTDLMVQRTMLNPYIDDLSSKTKVKPAELIHGNPAQDAVKARRSLHRPDKSKPLTLVEIKFFSRGMLKLLEKYVPNPDERRDFIADLNALIPHTDDAEEKPARRVTHWHKLRQAKMLEACGAAALRWGCEFNGQMIEMFRPTGEWSQPTSSLIGYGGAAYGGKELWHVDPCLYAG